MEEYTEKNIKDLENQLLSKIGNFSTRKKDAVQYEKSIDIFILSDCFMS